MIGKKIHLNGISRLLLKIGKRQRFIIATLLQALIMLSATFYSFEEVIIFIPLLIISSFLLTYVAIVEGITRREWIMLFIHQVYFSVVFYLFYFFLPQRWLTRLPFIMIYSVCMYAILLSQNIFNIGAQKSLQLFRAAFSVNYLFLTISAYLGYSVLLSFRLSFLWNFLIVFLMSFPLALHMLWSVSPKDEIQKDVIKYSGVISLLLAQVVVILSFIPVRQAIFALLLTSIYYSLSGLFQVYMQGTVYKERVREYIFVLLFASVLFVLALG